LLKILSRRGLTVATAQRRRILGCTDLATLERWLDRSFSVSSVEALLAPPAKRSRGALRRSQAAPANGRRRAR
jgi:hypothetical protein